ncbi:MAG: hypothetical protein ABJN84_03160 [Flavobacteriaceae bacterium]
MTCLVFEVIFRAKGEEQMIQGQFAEHYVWGVEKNKMPDINQL